MRRKAHLPNVARDHDSYFCCAHVRRGFDCRRDPVMGEIYVIGIDPTAAGSGLGTALTIAGLQSIASRGVDVGMLYVDADNNAAMKMYRNLGFEVHRTDVAFVGDF